jgi:hypothetical protein
MSLKLRWVGEDERDRVGETRGCATDTARAVAEFIDYLRNDRRTRGNGCWPSRDDIPWGRDDARDDDVGAWWIDRAGVAPSAQ